MKNKKVSIIGAGNGGQAFAGFFAIQGYEVCLYNRTISNINNIEETREIRLTGQINNTGRISYVTDNIAETCEFSDLLFIVTPATSHKQLARQLSPYLRSEHTIILNPGRTFGSLEFERELSKYTSIHVNIGETQTLVYACRVVQPGLVNIIGIKDRVPISCTNNSDIKQILSKIKPIFPCFEKGKSLLEVGFDNIGSIFHPAVVLFNAATIERQESFYFYRDMTPQIASVIEALDQERINIGKSYELNLMPVKDWIVYAYPDTQGEGLCERMKNNPAYHDIKAPGSIFTRQLTEDIPTGLLPMSELGHLAGVETPLMDSIITIVSSLLDFDFRKTGRTLENLGLGDKNKQQVMELLG